MTAIVCPFKVVITECDMKDVEDPFATPAPIDPTVATTGAPTPSPTVYERDSTTEDSDSATRVACLGNLVLVWIIVMP